MTRRGLLLNKHARWLPRGPDNKRPTETSSEFESQLKTKKYIQREKRGDKNKEQSLAVFSERQTKAGSWSQQ